MQIARMNAQLTATAKGFAATFGKAGKSVGTFGSQVSGVASKLTGIAGVIGLTGAAYGLQALVRGQMEAIDTTAKLGDTLGIATENLMGLQYAASFSGTSVEDLGTGLAKMTKLIGEASMGTPAAVKAIAQLGLEATQLANMAPDEAFKRIADALNAVENPAQRAAMASDIFGKNFAKMMPLIREGSSGLAKFQEEAIKTGFALNRVDAAKVEMANDAVQKISNLITGLGNQIAVNLAPYIQGIADKLFESAAAGEGMGAKVSNAVEGVASAVAYAADYLELFKSGWHVLRAVVLSAAMGTINAIDLIGQNLTQLLNLLPGIEVQWTSTFSDISKAMGEEISGAMKSAGESFDRFQSGANSQAVAKFFDEARVKAQALAEEMAKNPPTTAVDAIGDGADKVAEKLASLNTQLATLGMSDSQKLAYDLKQSGATPEQIASAVATQETIDAAKELTKAHDDAAEAAKRYYEETRTPAEKYAAEIERINELMLSGTLDPATAQRAADAAGKAYADATKETGTVTTGPQLLQAGSQAAASFVAASMRRETGNDPTTKVAKNTAKTNTILNELPERIAAANAATVLVNF